MGNLFSSLSNGSNAMSYYMRGIETAGHNIANAGTEGFARQKVNASSKAPVNDGGVLVGQGLSIDSITRVRSQFLDAQYVAQLPALGYWETRVNCLKNLEYYSGQVGIQTYLTSMNNFWTEMENVHIYPDSATSADIMLDSAQAMITELMTMRSQYEKYRQDLNDQVYKMVQEANGLIDDIALLCEEIAYAKNRGETPNDLLDKRDLLAERLCKLTGATVGSPVLDEGDGDYKIDLHGKTLVQGAAVMNCDGTAIRNVRHLVMVPMIGNSSYYDVQVEANQFDHSSNYSVASVVVERGAVDADGCSRNGLHELFVERMANGRTWTVGGAKGIHAGGGRVDTVYNPATALGVSGSFSLQVGTNGVKATSRSFAETNGVVKTGIENAKYEFRVAAGEFDTLVQVTYDSNNNRWDITTDNGATTLGTVNGRDLKVEDIQKALNVYPQLAVNFDGNGQRLSIEGANTDDMRGRLLSITDVQGSLASDLGLTNGNPVVEIKVTDEDSLQTIANKINAAYQSEFVSGENQVYNTNPPGVAPSSPEQWLHAKVITEPDGSCYIALVSNVSGEANRINVLPGDACDVDGDGIGDYSIAEYLGFVDSGSKSTSYMQFSEDPNATSTIVKEDVHAQDAYFIYDGRHYLSESNSFAEARIFKTTDSYGNVVSWDNAAADKLARFATGVRLNLNGLNHFYNDDGTLSGNEATYIKTDQHLQSGQIYAMLECRDDMILGFIDYFDNLVYKMVTEVNAVHYSGHGTGKNSDTTGTAFFKHVNARYGASKNWYLNAELEDTSLVATGSGDGEGHSKGVGDGNTAQRIAQLKSTKLFENGTADFDSYFRLFVADLGTQGYTGNYMLETQQNVADQIQTQRDAVMGVSTDEEMLDIVRFQQGVGAISRYMTALDDMLDRIINGMGRAGL